MMQAYELYHDISKRTQGDLYIGVVGPVRTGKSTLIKRFMEKLVIPGIENAHIRSRMQDELPQCASGRMVMTTQPAFIPNEAVEVNLPGNNQVKIRLIDSVGYLVDGALGAQEGDAARMVETPWFSEQIPFEKAAEIGTQKVIGEHSTLALVVTTDGTATDLPRSAYVSAEKRAINELKELGKPFVVILNSSDAESIKTESLRRSLEEEYSVPVMALDVADIEKEEIANILMKVLEQFPVLEVTIQTPEWLSALDESHWLVESMVGIIESMTPQQLSIREMDAICGALKQNEYIDDVLVRRIDHGKGTAALQIMLQEGLFNQILAEQCGTEIKSDAHLLSLLCELVQAKREYDRVAEAIQSVKDTGYGLVSPSIEEMSLQEPEIMKQGGSFGVRLRASAPSLHMIRVNIQTEVSPVVGTEEQSEEMVRYLMNEFETDPQKIWQSNLFGKPLYDLVREGLANKLMHMPEDTQIKVKDTLEKIINEGNGGMICILL